MDSLRVRRAVLIASAAVFTASVATGVQSDARYQTRQSELTYVPEYWESSGQGVFPFDASNEAYKLGVNHLIYGLTH